ncbi:hypothetical protein U879_18660 [Defluviimonas sp. 20V17]|uniref:Uncharacterized protein n=1 Tax=Allgaiera indica TaxID=765699 RepID=A0AAN4US86_9RHOB|nr:site-specific integrase [Allgaiera indica]KDB02157.1 hypothetical protein U879_18660 [Defluviimonas sp. 20V17]GHE02640.1 hypothetical protein GCM10008024_22990 [Allgaiera indica]SDX19896.1 hypothetical protein SAMN05444006_111129 [Allgaiera indica]
MECFQEWPVACVPALQTVLKEAGDELMQRRAQNVLTKYTEFSRAHAGAVQLGVNLARQFRTHLQATLSATTANSQFRIIYRIGILSSDLLVRDWFFENAPDMRVQDRILASPWWPDYMRLLAPEMLEARQADGRQILGELDNYLRFRQRHPQLPADGLIDQMFLTEEQTSLRKYLRMGKLVVGLELLDPGTPELAILRTEMLHLHREAYPPQGLDARARHLPEVEELLRRARKIGKKGRGAPYSEAATRGHRFALTVLHDVLMENGQSFSLNRAALDIFVDHVVKQHERYRENHNAEDCWTATSCATVLKSLIPFVEGKHLRADLNATADYFCGEATLEIKAKERKLAQHPLTLESYFESAAKLFEAAMHETRIAIRNPKCIGAGLIALLVFYPLRRADVRKLRVGVDIKRTPRGWQLIAGSTQKAGTPIEPVRLPDEATPFLDGALLQGVMSEHLWQTYEERIGKPLFPSRKTGDFYSAQGLSELFRRESGFGFGPHIMRSLWVDALVAEGEDRQTISAMLQHRNLMSQKEYEVFATKIRRSKAIQHVTDLANRALAIPGLS